MNPNSMTNKEMRRKYAELERICKSQRASLRAANGGDLYLSDYRALITRWAMADPQSFAKCVLAEYVKNKEQANRWSESRRAEARRQQDHADKLKELIEQRTDQLRTLYSENVRIAIEDEE